MSTLWGVNAAILAVCTYLAIGIGFISYIGVQASEGLEVHRWRYAWTFSKRTYVEALEYVGEHYIQVVTFWPYYFIRWSRV